MKLTQISHEVKLDKSSLLEYLNFLIDRSLAKKQYIGESENSYVMTERGLSVLQVIGPMVKEAHRIEMRNFEAISSALSGVTLTSEKINRTPKRNISEYIREKTPKWKLSDLVKPK